MLPLTNRENNYAHLAVILTNAVKVFLRNGTELEPIHPIDEDETLVALANKNLPAILTEQALTKRSDVLYTSIAANLYILFKGQKTTFGTAATIVEGAYQQWLSKYN